MSTTLRVSRESDSPETPAVEFLVRYEGPRQVEKEVTLDDGTSATVMVEEHFVAKQVEVYRLRERSSLAVQEEIFELVNWFTTAQEDRNRPVSEDGELVEVPGADNSDSLRQSALMGSKLRHLMAGIFEDVVPQQAIDDLDFERAFEIIGHFLEHVVQPQVPENLQRLAQSVQQAAVPTVEE